MLVEQIQGRLRPHAPSFVPGVAVVAVMLLWVIDNGGYDAGTWYWGALLFLGMLAVMLPLGLLRTPPPGAALALALFGLYVAWSFASILWAQSPGDALQGSNRALLYLLAFALMLLLPWTPQAALGALLLYTLGVGAIAVVLLVRLASADHVSSLFVAGRLASPDRLSELHRCPVHDRRPHLDRARLPSGAPGGSARHPHRDRLREPAAHVDRREPGLAVHAAARRGRRARGRSRPLARGGRRGDPDRSRARTAAPPARRLSRRRRPQAEPHGVGCRPRGG